MEREGDMEELGDIGEVLYSKNYLHYLDTNNNIRVMELCVDNVRQIRKS